MAEVDTRRHLRQLMLTEVGKAGQASLVVSRFEAPSSLEAGADAVARDYLARAGVPVAQASRPTASPDSPMEAALDAVHGALVAVEHIKTTVAAGRAAAPSRAELSALLDFE